MSVLKVSTMEKIFSFVFLFLLSSVNCKQPINFTDFGNYLGLIFPNIVQDDLSSINKVDALLGSLEKAKNSEENQCAEQFGLLFKGVMNHELWALKMLDASAKFESGILYGNLFSFGNYDECLEIEHQYNQSKGNEIIKGQYCKSYVSLNEEVIKTKLPSALKLTYGLCVPSGCTGQDLQLFSDEIIDLPEIKIKFGDAYCSTKDTVKDLSTGNYIGLTIFCVFAVIILLATIADIYNLKVNNGLLKCFSMYANCKKLLKVSSNEDAINCLNGIRVLSMFLIMMGHRLITTGEMPAINRIFMETSKNYWYNYVFIGLGFAVDTFFVVSGLLVVYLYFRTIAKGRDIPWGMYYVHRIIRLSPSLSMAVLFYATMLPFLDEQPFAVIDKKYGIDCRNYWWTTLLYIQNYWNPNNMCVAQSWYLAIDTHLYFLAPILLIALNKFPTKTIWGVIVLICLSISAAFEITWEYDLGATYLHQNPDEYKYLYTPTHIRMTPWLLGALVGYYIAKNKDKSYPLSKVVVYCLWTLSFGSLIFVLLIQQVYHNSEYSFITSGLFNAFARTLWSAGICGIIWLCVFGHGGFINKFLSCSVFNVLIRINYAVYIVHLLIISTIVARIRTPLYLSNFLIVHETCGDYFLVVIVATIWTLAFESPIIGLEKIIFSRGAVKKNGNIGGNVNAAFKDNCDSVMVK